ncbi:MAG: hypothetical protein ABT940_13025, partial [Alphaproteobacteria bacterium]
CLVSGFINLLIRGLNRSRFFFRRLGGFEMSWRLGAYARRVIAGKRRLPPRVVRRGFERFRDRQVRRLGDQAYDRVLRAHALGQRLGFRSPQPLPIGLVHWVARDEGRNRYLERRGQELLPYDLRQRDAYNMFLRGNIMQEQQWTGDFTE